jgi:predicted nucleotidyltransferase
VTRFAAQLRVDIGATRVLLFGSRARGNAWHASDYDFIVVSPQFAGIDRPLRGLDLWELWRRVGGKDPIDTICVSPEEFDRSSAQGGIIADVLPEAVDLLPLADATCGVEPVVVPGRSFVSLPIDAAAARFARRLQGTFGAKQVLLYGPYARGTAYHDSEYDFLVVSPEFNGVERAFRGLALWELWHEVGGKAPMNTLCVTPEEFAAARDRATFIAAVLPEAIDLLPAVQLPE